jgi:hypothetical protein
MSDGDNAIAPAAKSVAVHGVHPQKRSERWPRHRRHHAKGSGKGTSAKTSHAKTAKTPKAPKPRTVKTPRVSVPDAQGRIQRSDAARHAFARQTGYPSGRPGYVIDHVVPLACGGADAPSNMQWQTVEAGKAKDRVERQGC